MKDATVREAIAGIIYLSKDALAASMTPKPDDGTLYGDNRLATMTQAMVHRSTVAKFESINFEIRLRQTIDDIVQSPWYLVKVTKALSEIDKLLELVAHLKKVEANRVTKASLIREERVKQVCQGNRKDNIVPFVTVE